MTAVEPQMAEALERHALVPILDTPKFQSFYMKRPGEGRIMSMLITFTPEGIVIQGDMTPGHHGNVSCLGYGLGWFRSRLSEDYMCTKFLQAGWYPKRAERDIRYLLKDIEDGNSEPVTAEKIKELEELADECEDGDLGQESFITSWQLIDGNDDMEDLPGWGYNPREEGWLCAIQQRFAELYDAKESEDFEWEKSGLGYALSH